MFLRKISASPHGDKTIETRWFLCVERDELKNLSWFFVVRFVVASCSETISAKMHLLRTKNAYRVESGNNDSDADHT